MKEVLTAAALTLFIGVILNVKPLMASDAYPYTGKKFLPGDMVFADPPTGHTPGKDNYVTTSPNRFHNPGEDCGICHAPNRKAGTKDFTVAGTVYKDKMGREPLPGAEIIIVDAASNVISMTSNEAGNFATQAKIAADPKAADSKGVALSTDNPSAWRYKSWVISGDQVIPMITIAPVGGTSTPRMGCGMHHSPKGSRGALWIGTGSQVPSYPASAISFKKHVLPILRAKCKSCHIPREAEKGNMITYTTTGGDAAEKYQFDGSLNLMSYSKDGLGGAYSAKGVADVLNTLLSKASKPLSNSQSVQHAGGWYWTETDSDYKVIKQWITEGAKNN